MFRFGTANSSGERDISEDTLGCRLESTITVINVRIPAAPIRPPLITPESLSVSSPPPVFPPVFGRTDRLDAAHKFNSAARRCRARSSAVFGGRPSRYAFFHGGKGARGGKAEEERKKTGEGRGGRKKRAKNRRILSPRSLTSLPLLLPPLSLSLCLRRDEEVTSDRSGRP